MKKMTVTQLPDISKYKVISFDIFDTLLLRNVLKPTDIFRLTEKEINYPGFAKKRYLAERIARTKTSDPEIKFDDIYNILETQLNIPHKTAITAKQTELNLEKELLVPNPFIKTLYDQAIKTGKSVYVISDMYLPQEVIKELLEKNGYTNYKKLYLSSNVLLVKGDGSLFKKAMEEEDIKPEDWLHVGDNEYADIKNAELLGIDTFYFPKVSKQFGVDSEPAFEESYSIAKSIMTAIQINNAFTNPNLNYWERFGILNVAPIHYGFVTWLSEQKVKGNNLYFLARDGYIVKKVFEEFQKSQKCLKNIKTHYLYASRMSLQLPALILTTKSELLYTLLLVNRAFRETVTVKDIMKLVDLDPKVYKPVLNKFGLKSENDKLTEITRPKFNKLVMHFYDQIIKNLKKRLELVKEYFKQEGLYDYNQINFVDVGWRGSVQKAIQEITKKRTFGYYLGVVDTVHDPIRKYVKGYLIQYNEPLYISDILHQNLMMFEFIFSAPEGTVLGFQKKNGRIGPITDPNENSEYIEAVKHMHAGVLKVVKQALPYHKWLKELKRDEVLENYVKFTNEKHYDDLQHFYKLTNNVGYGSKQTPYLKKYSQQYIKEHKKEFLDEISHSLWKNAFLIEGIESEEEMEEFINNDKVLKNLLKRSNTPKNKWVFLIKRFLSIFTLYNFIMFIRQPKRGIKVLIRKIKGIIKSSFQKNSI